MSSEIVERLREDWEMLKDGYQENLSKTWHDHAMENAAKDALEAASHIEALEAENERLWEFIGRVDTALRYEDDNAVFKSGNSVGAIRKGVVFLSQAKE